MPPVIHVDTDAPLYSDDDGRLITDKMWGIYYKPDFHFGGVQGAQRRSLSIKQPRRSRLTLMVRLHPNSLSVRNLRKCGYQHLRTARAVLGHLPSSSASPLAASVHSHPTVSRFDTMRENCFVLADSNHGYKMIGSVIGGENDLRRVAVVVATLQILALRRRRLTPVSNSPSPGANKHSADSSPVWLEKGIGKTPCRRKLRARESDRSYC